MSIDHEAILRAYPKCVRVNSKGAFDKDGNLISTEESKITSARTTLDAEAAAILYKKQRTGIAGVPSTDTYLSVGDQLDLLWHSIDADSDLKVKFAGFYNAIKTVKDKHPKP